MANATMSKDEILDAIGNMSVFELAELIEAFKTQVQRHHFRRARRRGSRRWWRGCRRRAGRRRADRVRGQPQGSRREEDPGHQGRARADRPRTEGSEGSRRRRAEHREVRRHEGRSGGDEGQARGAGSRRRSEVRARVGGSAADLPHFNFDDMLDHPPSLHN